MCIRGIPVGLTINQSINQERGATMSTKVTKRESVKFGEYEVAIADVVRVAQEDGRGTGYTTGLVATKAGKDKYALLPFARILELNGVDRVSSGAFNAFTKVWKDERRAAEAVHKFCDRFAIVEGDRAREILAVEEDDRKIERVKKSTAEKVAAALKSAKSKGAYIDIAKVSFTELTGAVESLAVGNIDAARAVIEEMEKFVDNFNKKHASNKGENAVPQK